MKQEKGRGVGPDPEEGIMSQRHHPRVSGKDVPCPSERPPQEDQDKAVKIKLVPDQQGQDDGKTRTAAPDRMSFGAACWFGYPSLDGFNALQILLFLQPKKAGWSHDQHGNEHEKIDGLLIFLADPVA